MIVIKLKLPFEHINVTRFFNYIGKMNMTAIGAQENAIGAHNTISLLFRLNNPPSQCTHGAKIITLGIRFRSSASNFQFIVMFTFGAVATKMRQNIIIPNAT